MRFSPITRKDIKIVKQLLSDNQLRGWKVVVVGGTNGLGQGISRELASKGADVTVVGRTFRDQHVKNIDFVPADFSKVANSKAISQSLSSDKFDMIVFTTGILAGPKRLENPEGIELDLAVSYLSRYVLTNALSPKLGTSRTIANIPRPRVFIMGFPGVNQEPSIDDFNSEKAYSPLSAHQNTVVANEALVLHSAKQFPHIDFFGLNPGFIKTDIRQGVFYKGRVGKVIESIVDLFNPSVEEYAKGIVPLLVHSAITGKSGLMFNQTGEAVHASTNLPETTVDRLMAESEKLVQIATETKKA
jgi:NAD(P)-dependent dehydrogenase (short-subunit alcohol dehydrogenase family)